MCDGEWLTPERAAEEITKALGCKNIEVTPSKLRSWLLTGKLIGARVDGL